MASLLIVNAHIVNEGTVLEGDVLIRHGRIEALGALQGRAADQVLDAGGRYLLPGMIDSQSVCQNGFSTLAAESRAAVAGGVTTLLEVGAGKQLLTTPGSLETLRGECGGHCHANFGFYLTATTDNLEAVRALDTQLVCGINLFLGAGTDNAAVMLEDPEQLEQLFQQAAVPLVAHCADRPAVTENEESYRGIYGDEIPVENHSLIHSDEAVFEATQRVLQLARKAGCRLQLMQVSSVRETGLLGELAQDDQLIGAEVAVPWLHFCDEDYPALGPLLKLDPAVKTAEDRAGLIQGVLDGSIELIGTGHHAVSLAAKRSSNYFDITSGMPMLQHALITLLEHYHDGIFSLELIA
ncbi:MAG TPA: dihydroorotase, partial [Thiolinea sp.]|nr:dihydroorotase [Thiolinea sp.]